MPVVWLIVAERYVLEGKTASFVLVSPVKFKPTAQELVTNQVLLSSTVFVEGKSSTLDRGYL